MSIACGRDGPLQRPPTTTGVDNDMTRSTNHVRSGLVEATEHEPRIDRRS